MEMVEHVAKQTAHLMARKKKKKGPDIHVPFEDSTPMTFKPPTKPHLLKFPPPPNSNTLENKLLIHGLLGDIKHPNYIAQCH
jgi:hypothetical protein